MRHLPSLESEMKNEPTTMLKHETDAQEHGRNHSTKQQKHPKPWWAKRSAKMEALHHIQ
jgi:hypothetical protein